MRSHPAHSQSTHASLTRRYARLGLGLLGAVALGVSSLSIPAQAYVIGNPDDGAGVRVLNDKDAWTANMHLGGLPEYAKPGESFTAYAEIYENHDVDLDDEDAVAADADKEHISGGLALLGASKNIVIDSITWECDDPAEVGEKACVNAPMDTFTDGESLTVAGETYKQVMISPYVLRDYAGWTMTINGHFTTEGKASLMFTGMDQSYMDNGGAGLVEQLTNNALIMRTTVDPAGAPAPVPLRDAKVNVAVTQDKEAVANGEAREYLVSYANTGTEDIVDAHLSGVYLVLPEADGSSRVSISCDDSSTAPCPTWAQSDSAVPVSDHDHGHDHGHGHGHDDGDHDDHDGHDHGDVDGHGDDDGDAGDTHTIALGIARFGNLYDGLASIPSGDTLVLRVRVATTLEPHEGDTRDRVASLDAFVREIPGMKPTEDSVTVEGVKGVITLAAAPADDDATPGAEEPGSPATEQPSEKPSEQPSSQPSEKLSEQPSEKPSEQPSDKPVSVPGSDAQSPAPTAADAAEATPAATASAAAQASAPAASVTESSAASTKGARLAKTGASSILPLAGLLSLITGGGAMALRRRQQGEQI